MSGLRRLALLAAALLAAGSALSQPVELDTSAALTCLTPAEGVRPAPEYPFKAYKANLPGRAQVALMFTGNTLAPEVEVMAQEGGADFVDAVKQAVAGYRVPCLPSGQRARLVFDFVFRADDRKVIWKPPVDAGDAGRQRMLGCLSWRTGETSPPPYPQDARRMNVQGRVLAKLRFVAADKPPEFELFHRESAKSLARTARFWLEKQRMPCFEGEPFEASTLFVFNLENDVYGFRAMTLIELLRLTKGLEDARLSVDTRTMGCPFDLKFTYRQPLLDNSVGQVGSYDPAREPLVKWLRTVELDLKGPALDAVFADTADLAVPCINLQLTPKEKPK